MLQLMKKPPADRLDEEVSMLVKASAHLSYFEKLKEFSEHIGNRLLYDVCQRMHLLSKRKGAAVVNISRSRVTPRRHPRQVLRDHPRVGAHL